MLRNRRGFSKLAGFGRHMQGLSWFPHSPTPNPTMHHSHSKLRCHSSSASSSSSSSLPALVLHKPRRPHPYLNNKIFLIPDAIAGTFFFSLCFVYASLHAPTTPHHYLIFFVFSAGFKHHPNGIIQNQMLP